MLGCLFRRCFFPALAAVACRRPPPARAGGGTATISSSKTRLRCLLRRCFFLIRAPVASRSPPPGASGPPLCRVFTLRDARTGVPHANWGSWLSNMPRFCGPARRKRRAARETDDLVPQRTDKTRQNRRARLRFLDSASLFGIRAVESSCALPISGATSPNIPQITAPAAGRGVESP